MTPGHSESLLGESLIAEGVLSSEQLENSLTEQRKTGRMLGEILAEQGILDSQTVLRTLAKNLEVPHCYLRAGLTDPSVFELVGEDEAKRLKAVPMFKVGDTLTVAMAEPQSLPKIDRLQQITGCKIRPVLALHSNILEFINSGSKGSSAGSNIDTFLASLSGTDVEVVENEAIDEGPATDLDRMVEGSPIVNLVNMAFMTAVRDGASDIHIEPEKKGTRIRYRIDGRLRDLMRPPEGLHGAIVSRVKVIGRMDIAEKRLPQEGRVRIIADGREMDLRVSSMPTLLGEKIVVRILDKDNLKVSMQELGFKAEALATFNKVIHLPHGLVLVTGPTGSGKTTTLYSALDLLRSPERNLVTVEDPVEYQLDMVNQIQVQNAIGMNFARALRSILRQDPDVIMVGEIRDEETARVAIQAALTGHLVLATLHTNDAAGAIARLLDMGIEPYLLSSALNGIVAQRLARKVCPNCSAKYFPSEKALHDAGLVERPKKPLRKGHGCEQCHNSGFLGRIDIYVVMEITPDLRELIHGGAATHEIRQKFREHGGLTLREEGVAIALKGQTTLEEVLSVTHSEDVLGDSAPKAERQVTLGGVL